jgi:hypothetical protein
MACENGDCKPPTVADGVPAGRCFAVPLAALGSLRSLSHPPWLASMYTSTHYNNKSMCMGLRYADHEAWA